MLICSSKAVCSPATSVVEYFDSRSLFEIMRDSIFFANDNVGTVTNPTNGFGFISLIYPALILLILNTHGLP